MKATDLPDNVRNSLLALIEYNWDSEEEDARGQLAETGNLEKHIFSDLVVLRNFALDVHDVAEELVAGENEDAAEDDDDDDDDDDDVDPRDCVHENAAFYSDDPESYFCPDCGIIFTEDEYPNED